MACLIRLVLAIGSRFLVFNLYLGNGLFVEAYSFIVWKVVILESRWFKSRFILLFNSRPSNPPYIFLGYDLNLLFSVSIDLLSILRIGASRPSKRELSMYDETSLLQVRGLPGTNMLYGSRGCF